MLWHPESIEGHDSYHDSYHIVDENIYENRLQFQIWPKHAQTLRGHLLQSTKSDGTGQDIDWPTIPAEALREQMEQMQLQAGRLRLPHRHTPCALQNPWFLMCFSRKIRM